MDLKPFMRQARYAAPHCVQFNTNNNLCGVLFALRKFKNLFVACIALRVLLETPSSTKTKDLILLHSNIDLHIIVNLYNYIPDI